MLSKSRNKCESLRTAILWSARVLPIIAILHIGGVVAREAEDVPHISDIRLFRKLGEYDRALGYLKTILAEEETPEHDRRQAYNELVTVLYLTEDPSSARSAAREALTEFPDLEADPSHYPTDVQEIYADLRKAMFGRLRLSSDPSSCNVYLDGKEIGSTPLEGIYVPIGERTLRISAFGYEDETFDVSIVPGGELERVVTLHVLREPSTLGLSVEFGASLVSLDYGGGAGGVCAGVGVVEDNTSVARFGGGIFLHMYRYDRLAVQTGLRYIVQGDRAYYHMYNQLISGQYYSYYRYLAVPVLVRYYPIHSHRIFLCAGPEFALLLSAELSNSFVEEPIDIMDHVQGGQVFLTGGAGYEIGVAGHYVMIAAYHTMGMLSLRKSTVWNTIDYKPREWRIAVSFIFNI